MARSAEISQDPPTDSALLASVAAGESESLACLYDRHATALFTLAVRILGDGGEAEDLVQDLFLEVWQRAGSFDPRRGSAGTWLRVRLRSRAIDRLRSRGARRALLRQAGVEELPGSAPAREAATRRSDARTLFEGFDVLTDRQREVLELAYFRGLSQREIAERCGIPLGTVKSRLAGAVAALRRALAGAKTGEPTHAGAEEVE